MSRKRKRARTRRQARVREARNQTPVVCNERQWLAMALVAMFSAFDEQMSEGAQAISASARARLKRLKQEAKKITAQVGGVVDDMIKPVKVKTALTIEDLKPFLKAQLVIDQVRKTNSALDLEEHTAKVNKGFSEALSRLGKVTRAKGSPVPHIRKGCEFTRNGQEFWRRATIVARGQLETNGMVIQFEDLIASLEPSQEETRQLALSFAA